MRAFIATVLGWVEVEAQKFISVHLNLNPSVSLCFGVQGECEMSLESIRLKVDQQTVAVKKAILA